MRGTLGEGRGEEGTQKTTSLGEVKGTDDGGESKSV